VENASKHVFEATDVRRAASQPCLAAQPLAHLCFAPIALLCICCDSCLYWSVLIVYCNQILHIWPSLSAQMLPPSRDDGEWRDGGGGLHQEIARFGNSDKAA